MTQPWLPPAIAPLTRLKVAHDMPIDAEDWQVAHEYHRDRQNSYYQSLYCGGIVCGLEVSPIAPPERVIATYRDGRWLQVQPGIAIDSYGNIIVVPEPIDFHLASKVTGRQPQQVQVVYLLLRYVDPEQLQGVAPGRVRETFRLEETNAPPHRGDIELCRIRLRADSEPLALPADVFAPEDSALDPRFRPVVRPRPEAVVRVGVLGQEADDPRDRFACSALSRLLQSCAGLYPAMVGSGETALLTLPVDTDTLGNYDLIYLSARHVSGSPEPQLVEALRNYQQQGGTLLLEISPASSLLADLQEMVARLQVQLAGVTVAPKAAPASLEDLEGNDLSPEEADAAAAASQARWQAELADARAALVRESDRLAANARQLLARLGIALAPWESVSLERPERSHPFQFDAFPDLGGRLHQLWLGNGAIVALGQLALAWGGDARVPLDRQTLRTAQELGIDFLLAACQRRQLTRALHPTTPTEHA